MSFFIFFLLLLVIAVVFSLKRVRTGLFLTGGTLVFVFAVGGGSVPFLLLDRLEIYLPLKAVHWGNKNAIVVLGGGTVQWEPELPLSSTLFGQSRVHEAARLYFECKKVSTQCSILASGGDPIKLGTPEASVMKRELTEIGVLDSDIILESKSNNTFQNAQFSSSILSSQKNDVIILVTSGSHLSRGLLYFSYFGIHALPSPSDHLEEHRSWLPLSYNLFLTDLAVHEYLGVFRFWLYNKLGWNPKRTASGES